MVAASKGNGTANAKGESGSVLAGGKGGAFHNAPGGQTITTEPEARVAVNFTATTTLKAQIK